MREKSIRCYFSMLNISSVLLFFSFFLFSCDTEKNLVEGRFLFSMPFGNLPGEFKVWDSSIDKKTNSFLKIREGIFYIANGNRVLKISSNGYLLDYISNDYTLHSNVISSAEGDIDFYGDNIPFHYYPLEKVEDVAVDSKGRLLIVNSRLLFDRGSYFKRENKVNNSELLVYGGAGLEFKIEEDGEVFQLGSILGMYTQANNNIVVTGKNEIEMISYLFNKEGKLLRKIIFPSNQFPSFDSNSSEDSSGQTDDTYFAIIDNIIPSYKNNYLYVQYTYYKKKTSNYGKKNISIDSEVSRIYRFNIKTSMFEEYIDLPNATTQLLQVLSDDRLLMMNYYDLLEDGIEDSYIFEPKVSILDTIKKSQNHNSKIKHVYNLSVPDIDIYGYQFSADLNGNIAAYMLLKDRVEVYWWEKQ